MKCESNATPFLTCASRQLGRQVYRPSAAAGVFSLTRLASFLFLLSETKTHLWQDAFKYTLQGNIYHTMGISLLFFFLAFGEIHLDLTLSWHRHRHYEVL